LDTVFINQRCWAMLQMTPQGENHARSASQQQQAATNPAIAQVSFGLLVKALVAQSTDTSLKPCLAASVASSLR